MEVIPAVDIRGGKCVRLFQGDYERETVFADDPLEMALRWEAQGAPRLHIVDLDGAREGSPRNLQVVSTIAARVKIPTELGGGIRTLEIAKRVLDAGVGRVIVGTSAARDPALLARILEDLGEQAVVSIDARDGRVSVAGWLEDTDLSAVEFARQVQQMGACRIIFTDIAQDGTLAGVNVESIRRVLEIVSIPVIAAGGVTTIADIMALKALEAFGLEGVIAGRAIYAGALDLREAIRVAR